MILRCFIYYCSKFQTDTINQTVFGKRICKTSLGKMKTISSHLKLEMLHWIRGLEKFMFHKPDKLHAQLSAKMCNIDVFRSQTQNTIWQNRDLDPRLCERRTAKIELRTHKGTSPNSHRQLGFRCQYRHVPIPISFACSSKISV